MIWLLLLIFGAKARAFASDLAFSIDIWCEE